MRKVWRRAPIATRILLVLQGVSLLVCVVMVVLRVSNAIGFGTAAVWSLPLVLLVTLGPVLAGQVNRHIEFERIARRTTEDDAQNGDPEHQDLG